MPVSGRVCNGHDLSEYAGNVAITNGGRTCQMWTRQTPHSHHFTKNLLFTLDGSVEDAANFCRNLHGETTPWCYTTDPRKRRDYCDRPICGGLMFSSFLFTEDPSYSDLVCYQRFCCLIEFAVINKLYMDPSKASITDTFEQFL